MGLVTLESSELMNETVCDMDGSRFTSPHSSPPRSGRDTAAPAKYPSREQLLGERNQEWCKFR